MANEGLYNSGDSGHILRMEARRKLAVSGVNDVESFDDNSVVCSTGCGILVIRGAGLHIDKLSLDSGELTMSGQIDSVEYEEGAAANEGFFSRLFK